jgi:hypothetical protein
MRFNLRSFRTHFLDPTGLHACEIFYPRFSGDQDFGIFRFRRLSFGIKP